MTNCLERNDHVLFDITNAFRSLPVIAFAAVGFLRVVRHVTVEGLIYGAYEARNQDVTPNETPIFDLLPVARLLEWTTATDKFLTSGDARELAYCLRQSPAASLTTVANQLTAVSQALALARPRDVLPLSAQLVAALQQAEGDVRRQSRPFNLLLERTRRDFQAFAEDQPDTRLPQSLAAQWRLIGWYFDKQQLVQAATLAREWVISVLCWKVGAQWRDGNHRDDVESGLGAYVFGATRRKGYTTDYEAAITALDPDRNLSDLWSQLAPLRNQLAHCDIRQGRSSASGGASQAKKLAKKVRALREPLRALAEKFSLAAPAAEAV